MKQILYILLAVVYLTACVNQAEPKKKRKNADDIPKISYSIVQQFPHSTSSFTQGLLIHHNEIFESTGAPIKEQHAKSVFGILNLETGEIDIKHELNRDIYWGEGIVILNDKIYQITYKKQTCFVYDANSYEKIGEYFYENEEGWGLTTDGEYIIMSDGTNVLTYRDPSNFQLVKTLEVSSNNYAVDYLNELEYMKGYIFANVWPSDIIIKIDPKNGHVLGKIDLSALREQAYLKNRDSYETNGIAYDSVSDLIYVTGKMWPDIYQIKLSD